MIVRILGEGQWDLSDADFEKLNELDAAVESAIENGDEETFAVTLSALLGTVRGAGTRLADDELAGSDVILPPADASIAEVRELLSQDGLIPG